MTGCAQSASGGRRPLEGWERPYVRAVGEQVRLLRRLAGITQLELATAAELGERGLRRIERGERRTRHSTLRRLVTALTRDPAERVSLLQALVTAAGPALAPESEFEERVAARRGRRSRAQGRRYLTRHVVVRHEVPGGVLEAHWHSRRTGRSTTNDRYYVRWVRQP